jgi:putative lipoic acid-binding regulatory protein
MENSKEKAINYPCVWNYTIIGADSELMRKAVLTVFKDHGYTIQESRSSKNGKYTSLEIITIVSDEEQRTWFFKNLSETSAIKLIL